MRPFGNYFGVLLAANAFVAVVFCACLPEGNGEAADDLVGQLPQLPQLGGLGGLGGVGQQLGGLGLPGLGGNKSSCKCVTKYEPICASDGKTYDNECLFKCAAKMAKKSKNKAKNLKITKQGACMEQDST